MWLQINLKFIFRFTVQGYLTCVCKLGRRKLNLIAGSHSDNSPVECRLQQKSLVWKNSIYLLQNSKEEWVYMAFYCLGPILKQSNKQLPGSSQQTNLFQKILFNLLLVISCLVISVTIIERKDRDTKLNSLLLPVVSKEPNSPSQASHQVPL